MINRLSKQVILLLAMIFVLACGGADAQQGQAGLSLSSRIPQHHHSGPNDGGTLNSPSVIVTISAGNQLVTCGTVTTVGFDTKIGDFQNWYNTGTFRYIPQSSGEYYVSLFLIGSATTPTVMTGHIRKNGGDLIVTATAYPTTAGVGYVLTVPFLVSMNGTTDYIDISSSVGGASNCQIAGGNGNSTLIIFRVSN